MKLEITVPVLSPMPKADEVQLFTKREEWGCVTNHKSKTTIKTLKRIHEQNKREKDFLSIKQSIYDILVESTTK